MSGPCIQRWTIGKGGFIGEVTLFQLSEEDSYIRGRDRRVYVELSDLHVHPLRRGRGWSRELLRTALAHAEEQGWCVFLRAVPYNAPAMCADTLVEFYARYGFKSTKYDRREMVLKWPKKRS